MASSGGVEFMFLRFVVFSTLLFLGACSPNFDRDDATQLIAASAQMDSLRVDVRTVSDVSQHGVDQGLWSFKDGEILLSAKASKEIVGVGGGAIRPLAPVSIKIDITGLRDLSKNPGVKSAEFLWSYKDLTPIVKRFALVGGVGTATFNEYDDGWRLSDLRLNPSEERVALNDYEMAEIERDIQGKQKEIEDIKDRIRESFKYKDQGFSKMFLDSSGEWGIEVNENDVRWVEKFEDGIRATITVWYGSISVKPFHNIGFDIQPTTPCRYGSIFKRSPSGFSNAEIITLINKKKSEWDAKHGHLDPTLSWKTYCEEHGPRGAPKSLVVS